MLQFHFSDRHGWRTWLEKNHNAETGVWLIFYKKHTGRTGISYDAAVEEALCFGWIDSIVKRIDEEKFVRKFTPRKAGSGWSESNIERAERMVERGRMTDAGLAQIREAKKSGRWFSEPLPVKEFEVPRFVLDALAASPKALENFENLAGSYRRLYVGWIMSAKRDETRKRRLAEVVGRLAKNERLGMK
jgi:uncharacterized protein YdeI (YjbR/CyaY-like superfamily)